MLINGFNSSFDKIIQFMFYLAYIYKNQFYSCSIDNINDFSFLYY